MWWGAVSFSFPTGQRISMLAWDQIGMWWGAVSFHFRQDKDLEWECHHKITLTHKQEKKERTNIIGLLQNSLPNWIVVTKRHKKTETLMISFPTDDGSEKRGGEQSTIQVLFCQKDMVREASVTNENRWHTWVWHWAQIQMQSIFTKTNTWGSTQGQIH